MFAQLAEGKNNMKVTQQLNFDMKVLVLLIENKNV